MLLQELTEYFCRVAHDYVCNVTVCLHGQGRWWLINNDCGHNGCCSPSLIFYLVSDFLCCFHTGSYFASRFLFLNMSPVFKECRWLVIASLFFPGNINVQSPPPPKKQPDWFCFFLSSLYSVAFSNEPNMKIRFPATMLFASNGKREQRRLGTVAGKTWKRRTGWQPGMTKPIILNSQWDLTPHLEIPNFMICFYTRWTFYILKYFQTKKKNTNNWRLNTWTFCFRICIDLGFSLYESLEEHCSVGDICQLYFWLLFWLQCWLGASFSTFYCTFLLKFLYLFFFRNTLLHAQQAKEWCNANTGDFCN